MALLDLVPTLPAAGTLDGTEPIGVQKNGVPSQTTTQAIANLASLGATITPNELWLNVYNGTGGTLSAGTLVYVSSYDVTAGKYKIAKADADVAGARAQYIVSADIADATAGAVVRSVVATGLNTSSTSVGDPVYLSATAGAITKTAPTASNSIVQVVGRVIVVHASTGTALIDLVSNPVKAYATNEYQDASVTAAKLAATAVTAGDYTYAGFTVDAQGRLTAAASGATPAATGVLVGIQVLTTGTAAAYVATAGATVAVFEGVGAGGGGGGADTDGATTTGVGGGGGGGGYYVKRYTTLTGITYTIGAFGAGGAAGNNAGVTGGDTSSTQTAVTVTAKGGAGGASSVGNTGVLALPGGAGGAVSTNGDVNAGGQAGGTGISNGILFGGVGGPGGGSRYGGGALGSSTDANGSAAANFGAGGGGGLAPKTGSDRAGGNGSGGVIVIYEYR